MTPYVREIDSLINEIKERMAGLSEMAEVEEQANYGTGIIGAPEITWRKLSICLDGLCLLRRKELEHETANKV